VTTQGSQTRLGLSADRCSAARLVITPCPETFEAKPSYAACLARSFFGSAAAFASASIAAWAAASRATGTRYGEQLT
jgi:hypothetical protein